MTKGLSLNGEFITAQYGKDVTKVDNSFGRYVTWKDDFHDFTGADAKEDSNIIDLSANYNFSDNLKLFQHNRYTFR